MISFILILGYGTGLCTLHLHLPAQFHAFVGARLLAGQPPLIIAGFGAINLRLEELLQDQG